jgi:magnesium transporter
VSTRTLVTAHGVVDQPDDAAIEAAFRDCAGAGFWLDITAPDGADLALLEHGLAFHPLTIDDIQHHTQRPKFEDYGSYSFVVLFSAQDDPAGLIFGEHHVYASPHYCVSVRHEASSDVDQLLDQWRKGGNAGGDTGKPPMFSYLVMDQIVDSLFAVLDTVNNQVDATMDAIIGGDAAGKLVVVSRLKHQVSELRRVLGSQQDLFQRLVSHVAAGGSEDVAHYYRDVYDHVIRQYDMVDSLRDLLGTTMDIYLSTVSNRLNGTVKTLTVIASVFLPLTFLTGFFGMNFAFLVGLITAPWTFAIGIALMLLSVTVQYALFRHHGWI